MIDAIALYALAAWNEPRLVEAAVCGLIIFVGTVLAAAFLRYPPEDAL